MDKGNNKQTLLLWIVSVFVAAILVAGGTYAYLSWQTSASQKTQVTFTVESNFSCAVDGGGNISNGDVVLIPTDSCNGENAIKRTVKVMPTTSEAIRLSLWLNVNTIGKGLTDSENLRYVLTTSEDSCTTNIVTSGTFNGITAGNKVKLLSSKTYQTTTTDTYYLYIWLDAAETSTSTMNQSISLSLGGTCTNDIPTPSDQAIYRLSGDWVSIGDSIQSVSSYVKDPTSLNKIYYLKHIVENDIITESYVEFIVTPTMAASNQGMTAGTYYLKGGDDGAAYEDNKTVLLSAFGSSYCWDYSSDFYCDVPGLTAYAEDEGYVYARDDSLFGCLVAANGVSYCYYFD